jgi:hypothetical protein
VVDHRAISVERRALKRRLSLWMLGSAVGVLIIGLPDNDDRLFSIAEAHGPSFVDLVGVTLIIGAWLPVVAALWSRRGMLPRRENAVVVGAASAGAVVVVVTIALDIGAAWVIGVALLVVAQFVVIRSSWTNAGAGS